jgi:HEAT repeat protein
MGPQLLLQSNFAGTQASNQVQCCVMSRTRSIVFLLAVLVLGTAAARYIRSQREPTYQGKRLSQWLAASCHAGPNSADGQARACEAVRAIGKRAIPRLLEMLQTKDSPLKLTLMRLHQKQSLVKIAFTPDYISRRVATEGFWALGPQAKDALPQLVRLFHDTNIACDAACAMARIGPESVGILREGLTNLNDQIRVASANGLAYAGSNAWVAVPDLVARLKDTSSEVRLTAEVALGGFAKQPEVVVPALVEILDGSTHSTRGLVADELRRYAAEALGRFGQHATSAVPALLRALSDTNVDQASRDLHVQAIINALRAIDPTIDPTAAAREQGR